MGIINVNADHSEIIILLYFFLYFSSGWLQDRSGKWVKDENVEFDSDEEEPTLLPPCSESS